MKPRRVSGSAVPVPQSRDLEVRAFGDQDVEIEAALAATSADGDALDASVARLGGTSVVSQAFWSASTTE
ncbi:hypothetical protein ACUXAV_002596 [Cupriavidus metallidurans]